MMTPRADALPEYVEAVIITRDAYNALLFGDAHPACADIADISPEQQAAHEALLVGGRDPSRHLISAPSVRG